MFIRFIYFLIFVLLLLMSPVVAHAKIYILIDEVSSKKFPIAVPQFLNVSGKESKLTIEMTSLVKRDLGIAGMFKVLDENYFIKNDTDVSDVDFAKWKAIEAYGLIKGIVDDKNGKRLMVEMRLYDVQTESLIVGKQYVVYQKDYAIAIHRFMDEVLQGLTGEKGPFTAPLVAACGRNNARQIQKFSVDGTLRTSMTQNKSNNLSPNWSPDGKSVVFTSFLNFFPEIFLVGLDGKGLKALTADHATNITPAFSPNGSAIAYASSRTRDTELYLMSPSGGMIRRLTQILNIDVAPSWSPDGSQIVFSSERAGNLHLFMMDVQGGGISRLTYTGYQNDQPDWSPDGKKIVFTARDRGAFDIFIMNSDGSLIQRLTRDEGNNESPTWSPDSRYIAFSSGKARSAGVYVMMADGSNQTLIPDTGGCINPDWGPRLK